MTLRVLFRICVAFLLQGQHCFAEPSGTINKLMNEPINYFEYGMDQLSRYSEEIAKDVYSNRNTGEIVQGLYVGRAEFDWNNSQIIISLSRFTYLGEDPLLFEGECSRVIDVVRKSGGIDFSTNRISQSQIYSNFARLFIPKSHSLGSLPTEEIGKTLDTSISIKVRIQNPENAKRLICTGTFIGTGYAIQK